jgi:glycosyltransferase involved in cell wall biosynthesis
MRICLVGPTHPYRGGISHFTAMLAREMSGAHDVHIVSFSRLYPGFLFPGRTQFDESASPLTVESERVIDSINPFAWRRAADAVLAHDPGVVVFQWWHPFFAPAFRAMCNRIRRRSDARIVFLCHNVLPHESSPVDRVLTRWGLGGAHAFITQSHEDKRRLLALIPRATVVVHPHPTYTQFTVGRIDRDSARERLDISGRVLLFFGLIRRYKGVDTLIDAFARVADELDATLLLVGEFYEDREPYEERIRAHGLTSRVRVVDRYVPDEEVGVYFSAADLVVLPYRSATQSGIAQTAFAFELPVVVSAVGGLPDVVREGETGYVVPPENPEAVAEAIRRFYLEDRAGAMAAAIRADAYRFSWGGCAAAVLAAAEASQGSG